MAKILRFPTGKQAKSARSAPYVPDYLLRERILMSHIQMDVLKLFDDPWVSFETIEWFYKLISKCYRRRKKVHKERGWTS